MEARLRKRRMILGVSALVSGLGMWLFTGYIYWLPYVTYQEELAAYEAKSAAVSALKSPNNRCGRTRSRTVH